MKKRRMLKNISRRVLSGLFCVVLTVSSVGSAGLQVSASELQMEQEVLDEERQDTRGENSGLVETDGEEIISVLDLQEETESVEVFETQILTEEELETETRSSVVSDETEAVENETQVQSETDKGMETGTEEAGTQLQSTEVGSSEIVEAEETQVQSTETEGTQVQSTEMEETEVQSTETEIEETEGTEEEFETESETEEEEIDNGDSFTANGNNGFISYSIANSKLTITVLQGGDNKPYSSDGSAPWAEYIKSGNIQSVAFGSSNYALSDISNMFNGLTDLQSIDFTNFKSAKLTDASNLFYDCTSLTDIKSPSKLFGAKLNNISGMFYNCRSLKSFSFSGCTTNAVTNMSSMFYYCYGLNSVTFGSTTTNVKDMSYMFYYCYSLKSVDLTNLNTSNVTNMSNMFSRCSSLNEIKFGENFNTAKVENMSGMFAYTGLSTMDLTKLNTGNVTNMASMFAGSKLSSITFGSSTAGSNTGKVENIGGMFSSCSALKSIDLRNLNTNAVTNMSSMFSNCANLDTITFGGKFSTANVVNMSYMFSASPKLDNLDLKTFNTTNVISMASMFQTCTGMKTLDLTPLDTSNVTNMSSMFANCYALNNVIFGNNFNSAKVISMYSMFLNCRSLRTLDLSKFNVINATDMRYMFSGCSGLTTIDLSSFNAVKVQYTNYMFNNCTSLKALDLSAFNAEIIQNMSYMFNNCTSLETLDLSNFKTDRVTDMSYMLYNCNSLASLDLSSFDTSNVRTMERMFSNCNSMAELTLDHEKFKTGNVTTMSYTFSGCNRLEYVDTSNFDTTNVTDMECMFADCNSLQKLDVSSFNTSKVKLMREMFSRCNSLKELNVSNFDTSNITDLYGMFFLCINLEKIDISSFNTENVTNMRDMFYSCRNLKELDLSNFDAVKVTDVWNMLSECVGLRVLHTPLNLSLSLSLPKENPDDKWYQSGGDTAIVATLPQDLDYSIMLIKNKSFEYPCIIVQKTKTIFYRGEALNLDDLTVTYYDPSGAPTVLGEDQYTTNADVIDMRKSDVQTLTVFYQRPEDEEPLQDSIELNITGKMEVEISGIGIDSSVYNTEMVSYYGEAVVKIKGTDEIVPDGDITLMYGYGGRLMDGTPYPYSQNGKPPVNAGYYSMIVAVAEDNPYYTGKLEIPFTINKAPVIITAENVILTKNSPQPQKYNYTVEGLLKGKELDKEPSFQCVVDMSQVGIYDIIPNDADAGGNYEISYIGGTFEVIGKYMVEISGVEIDSMTYNAKPILCKGEPVIRLVQDIDTVITQEPGMILYEYSGTLKDGTPYEKSDEAPIDAGEYTLKIKVADDNEDYMGEISYPFEIRRAPVTITANDVYIRIGDALPETYTYEVEGLLDEKTLDQEPSFICYADTSREGSYYIIPNGADAGVNYEIIYVNGMLTVSEDGGIIVEEVAHQLFTGKPIKPEVRVYFKDGTLLNPGKDYTVKYFNNINADTAVESARKTIPNRDGKADDGFTKGMAYVVVTGKGNYTGTVYRNFYIDPLAISEDNVNEANGFSLKYQDQLVINSKKAQKSFQSIKYQKAMKLGEDYTMTLSALNAYTVNGEQITKGEIFLEKGVPVVPANTYGTFALTIEGIKNYKGSLTKTVYVTDKAHLMKNASISLGKNLKKVPYTANERGVRLMPAYYDKNGQLHYVTNDSTLSVDPDMNNAFTVKLNNQYLEYGIGKDFTVEYIDNDKVGTATMIVKGKGAYMGTKSVKFKIVGTEFNVKTVNIGNFQESMPYTGTNRIQEGVVLTDASGKQIDASGYTVTYQNNVNKGTATMIFTAKPQSGYTGSFKKTFKIVPAEMAAAVRVIPRDASKDKVERSGNGAYRLNGIVAYEKAGAKPSDRILLVMGEENKPLVLTEQNDYTIKYANDISKMTTGTMTMTIEGKGNLTGALTVTYEISKTELSQNKNLKITASPVSYNARKSKDFKYVPKIKVMDGKNTLKEGKDYRVEGYVHCTQNEVEAYLKAKKDDTRISDLQAIRPYAIISAVEGSGYTGKVELDLTIYETKLTASNVYVVIVDDADYTQTTYTGKQVTPEVEVYYGDSKAIKEARKAEVTNSEILTFEKGKYRLTKLVLKQGQNNGDYTLEYGENIKVGTSSGSVTVNGAGLYGGKVTAKFMIRNDDVYGTMVQPWPSLTKGNKLIFAQ